MKFCTPHHHEELHNGVPTTLNYVTFEDVIKFHGPKFAEQWKLFIERDGQRSFVVNGHEAYYYMDYQHHARTTDQWLNAA